MWRMLQQPEADDYVLATNETSQRPRIRGRGLPPRLPALNWEEHVKYDARHERLAEAELLIGDPAKAKAKLGWELEDSTSRNWSGSSGRCRSGGALDAN